MRSPVVAARDKVFVYSDAEGALLQMLTFIRDRSPGINVCMSEQLKVKIKGEIGFFANPIEALIQALTRGVAIPHNLFAELRFEIPANVTFVNLGDPLDCTNPGDNKTGAAANPNARDLMMATMIANTDEYYKNSQDAFVLIADNRTTNKLRVAYETSAAYFEALKARVTQLIERGAAALNAATDAGSLKAAWQTAVTTKLKVPDANGVIFWADRDLDDLLLAHNILEGVEYGYSENTVVDQLKSKVETFKVGNAEQLAHMYAKTMGAGNALHSIKNELSLTETGEVKQVSNEGHANAVIGLVAEQGPVRKMIAAAKPIVLIADKTMEGKCHVFVHGSISPETFKLALELQRTFCESFSGLAEFDLDLSRVTLQTLAGFFDKFYELAIQLGADNQPVNKALYDKLIALTLPVAAEQQNTGSPFTTRYGDVDLQSLDTEHGKTYQRVVHSEVAAFYVGHNPLISGGIANVHGLNVPTFIMDNSKCGFSCATLDTKTTAVTYSYALELGGAIQDRKYVNSAKMLQENRRLGKTEKLPKELAGKIGPINPARLVYVDANGVETYACSMLVQDGFLNAVTQVTAMDRLSNENVANLQLQLDEIKQQQLSTNKVLLDEIDAVQEYLYLAGVFNQIVNKHGIHAYNSQTDTKGLQVMKRMVSGIDTTLKSNANFLATVDALVAAFNDNPKSVVDAVKAALPGLRDIAKHCHKVAHSKVGVLSPMRVFGYRSKVAVQFYERVDEQLKAPRRPSV